MQRENVLSKVLNLLEQQGLATTTLERLAPQLEESVEDIVRYWPDREALIYDSLRYHAQQIDTWRRQLLLDESQTPQQKLLARYEVLAQYVKQLRYPGCLFIAACTIFPEADHPIHQLAEQQKHASHDFTLTLLQELEVDDAVMVADQMELILEGCLSKLMVKRNLNDVETARRLAEDILRIANCRKHGALS
ncbi:transcriptional regulator [Enterobacillus tribolii]|uniref:TetR family transcriptional regulator n=1 Tax=Enterobacillus tribolii TaxID=1487935 RepID=A0A370R0W9_9GAMM|nr:transcriptional regulator [Enterobacillus tribolii]MBW7982862.1 transcriptional regulator [Enterobacillus tribolii]RDK95577.1 TetR family transcriptional regulator [Enterobacillus tribolii]